MCSWWQQIRLEWIPFKKRIITNYNYCLERFTFGVADHRLDNIPIELAIHLLSTKLCCKYRFHWGHILINIKIIRSRLVSNLFCSLPPRPAPPRPTPATNTHPNPKLASRSPVSYSLLFLTTIRLGWWWIKFLITRSTSNRCLSICGWSIGWW